MQVVQRVLFFLTPSPLAKSVQCKMLMLPPHFEHKRITISIKVIHQQNCFFNTEQHYTITYTLKTKV